MIAEYTTRHREFVIEYDTKYTYSSIGLRVRKGHAGIITQTKSILLSADENPPVDWYGSTDDLFMLAEVINLAKKDIATYRKVAFYRWREVNRKKMFLEEPVVPGKLIHVFKNKPLNVNGFFLYDDNASELRYFPSTLRNYNFLIKSYTSFDAGIKVNDAIASIALANRSGKTNSHFNGWESERWYERGRKTAENLGIL